ncbi:MAG: hypothetical protein JWN65_2283 [Solirubrobacterales bacterium]|nr:hypothetical protein [Solirubrobacterales bacterium]
MRRSPSSVLLVVVALMATPGAATAHTGNPDFRSVIRAVTPPTPGLTLDVLSLDDRLEIVNRSSQTVVVDGYNEEPYLRIRPDGTVQVNRLSPATYLNQDRFGRKPTPAFANAKAAPQWQTIDRTGRYEWHDHRIHYMAQGVPPQVKDPSARTMVFGWRVPIAVGARKGAIAGTLFWQPKDASGPPVAAIAGFGALLALSAAAVVLTRRRRRAEDPDGDDDDTPVGAGTTAREAW